MKIINKKTTSKQLQTILASIIIVLVIFLLISSCDNNYVPKPRGYFRIDLPQKNYISLDTNFPYKFEYPDYAEIYPGKHSPNEPYWINIVFPEFQGILYISYKRVNNNLVEYLEDTRTMVVKLIPKASSIDDELILNKESNVFGLKYNINGIGAASPLQFFVTDSVNHFVRGALYFNIIPNNDSLAPVIDFIKEDIDHLIETFEWKSLPH
ncbi:MAG: gliding motility lipoprotein GldD [Bacteroidales bacterium]|nr:gliding motility lipoprotein GldD [Bacteroidales bacterium]